MPAAVRRSVERRAFLVQGSWNYRVMQGTGMAWALLPALRHLREGEGLDEAVARHAEHFNAHPYFASLALGALTRLEAEGASPDTVRRFRAAIRGPLGALGDRIVWATWLPLSAVVALLLYWGGAPGWAAAGAFLVVFNVLHLTIRFRGFALGYEAGTGVGVRLRSLALTNRAERMGSPLLFLVGALAGLLLSRGGSGPGTEWVAAWALAFALGLAGGVRLWRPTALITVGAVVLFFLLGLRAA